jgi:HlyD family secretion protein
MAEVVTNDLVLSLKKKNRKKMITISLAVLLVLGTGIFVYEKYAASQSTASVLQLATVKRGDVMETVSASGTVQAPKQVSLNFSGSGGEITSINVKVGDHVKAGQVLATLDDSTARTQVMNAQANLQSAQAHLAEVQQGSTPQDIAVQQANVDKAKAALDAAKNTYDIQKASEQMQKAKVTLDAAQTNYNREKSLFDAGAVPKSDLDQAKQTLDQAQADYQTAVVAYNQAQADYNNNLKQAQAAYDSAVAQLNQLKAPPKDSTVAQAQAAVTQAEAQLQQQEIALSKLTLKAPIDGVVTQVNGNVGEMPSNNPVIVLDNSDSKDLQVLAQVSQSDIGKIQAGMDATFTVSAYENKQFKGKVLMVYPEATTESGVTTYKVLLSVDNTEGLLKPGMTLNVTIIVGTHKNVLYIPAAALRDQNGKDGVFVPNQTSSSQTAKESTSGNSSENGSRGNARRTQTASPYTFKPVTIGYYSSDRVEITSGLKEGDQVVLSFNNNSGNNAGSSSSNRRSVNGFGGMGGIPGMGGAGGGRGGR